MKCFVIYFAFQHFVIRPLLCWTRCDSIFFQKVHLYDVTILDPLVMVRISITYFVKKKNVVFKKKEDFTWKNLKLIKFEVWEIS